jgi:HJR/Mrr/RecB family endonuclease
MTSVFISHASHDVEFGQRLAIDLQERYFEARTFKDLLPIAVSTEVQELDPDITHAISADAFFVPVLTPASVESRWVLEEIDAALREEERRSEIKILPALARHCSIPYNMQLRSPVDFTHSYEEGLADLIARLSAPKVQLAHPDVLGTDSSIVASLYTAEALQNHLLRRPESLYQLSPRQFEELIAKILAAGGYQVELTKGSADGGVDIFAFGGKDAEQLPILIQCKRYSAGKRVGVEAIRSLYGVMLQRGAKEGMIVTTGHFSSAAQELVSRSRDRWKVDLVDIENLLSWLSRSPSLNHEITRPLAQIRQRHGELIDKLYLKSLVPEEEEELRQIETALDNAEEEFYNPLAEMLRSERNRLRAASKTEDGDN